MPQHADTSVCTTPGRRQHYPRRFRTCSHERLHYKALETEHSKTTHEAQCSEVCTAEPYLEHASAQSNQAHVSNAPPISYTNPPQSNHKTPIPHTSVCSLGPPSRPAAGRAISDSGIWRFHPRTCFRAGRPAGGPCGRPADPAACRTPQADPPSVPRAPQANLDPGPPPPRRGDSP